MKLILLGPPGAGKGTLAVKAVDILKAPHVSTGAIFRSAIAAKTPLGLKVKEIIGTGNLVDDETTIKVIKERLAQNDVQNGYILDGFPRTICQAGALENISIVDRVVNFDAPDSIVLQRLGGRRVCRKCGFNFHVIFNKPQKEGLCDHCGGELFTRDDDQRQVIEQRLQIYRVQTAPLIDFYRGKGVLAYVDARPQADEVINNFKKCLGL